MINLEEENKNKRISEFMNYDIKFVTYETKFKSSPTYTSYINREVYNKSLKF